MPWTEYGNILYFISWRNHSIFRAHEERGLAEVDAHRADEGQEGQTKAMNNYPESLSKLMMKQGLEEMANILKLLNATKDLKTFGSHDRQRLDGTRHIEKDNSRVRLKMATIVVF